MDWDKFFAMNGYALYVWGSYGVVLLVFMIEVVMVRHRRTLILQQLRRIIQADSDK